MKKLEIYLNQKYKSFDISFNTSLLGDLVILSGVNGSGKTQLMDIIKGYEATNRNLLIGRNVIQDQVVLHNSEIVHKSFREYFNIGDFATGGASYLSDAANLIHSWVQNSQLYDTSLHDGYEEARLKARVFLEETFNVSSISPNLINRDDIKKALPRDFVLFEDDIFTNKISQIFYNYISFVDNKKIEAVDNRTEFSMDSIPTAPWHQLNDLFSKLNIDYRFKDNYKKVNDEIDEHVAIYAVNEDGRANLQEKRSLSDLSDGEKALISLTFAVLASDRTNPKLVLLDEYDAALNPSLINAFFVILEDFFISRDIQVILTTHSSATLSLAPENANFYEVYKAKLGRDRILPVQKDQYKELSIANKNFYDIISHQEERYQELETEKNKITELIRRLSGQVSNTEKVKIVTEGYNHKHIKKAISILESTLLERIDFTYGAENLTSKSQLKTTFQIISNVPNLPVTLFVWDCDATDLIASLQESGSVKKFAFSKNKTNSKVNSGIENLYPDSMFPEQVYSVTSEEFDGGEKTIKKIDKIKFLKFVEASVSETDFENYRPLIDYIKSFIFLN